MNVKRPGAGRPQTYKVGDRLGMLTVIADARPNPNAPSHRVLFCRCDCGNTREVTLKRARTVTGCEEHDPPKLAFAEKRRSRPKIGTPEEAALRTRMSIYKSAAKKRGYVFELNLEQFKHLVNGDCHYCADVGPNGIDRKDNKLGYTTENAVSCCSVCNVAKSNLSVEEFLAWIHRVAQTHPLP